MVKKVALSTFLLFLFLTTLCQIPKIDKKGDPVKDLIKAKEIAQKENKKIMVIVGGDWCDWCDRFDNFVNNDKDLSSIVKDNFVVMKVYSEKDLSPNSLFLLKFPAPPAFPHIYILNSKGELLESKKTEELEKGESYDKVKVKEFLVKYSKTK